MSINCPHCGKEQQPRIVTRDKSQAYEVEELGIKDDPRSRDELFVGFNDYPLNMWAIGKCLDHACKGIFLLTRNVVGNDWEVDVVIPHAGTEQYVGAPETVKSAYEQAQISLAAGCSDASAAMCRAALERIAKDKGAKGRMLINKLKDLQEKGILTGVVYNAADRVRDWGNKALHELLEEPVDEEVTKRLLTLVDLVIRDVYVTPAQIETLET